MKFLMDNNLTVNENKIEIKFGLVISDTPARAMVKGETLIYTCIFRL